MTDVPQLPLASTGVAKPRNVVSALTLIAATPLTLPMRRLLHVARRLEEVASDLTAALRDRGFYENAQFLQTDAWRSMRAEAERLRAEGRFSQSLSVGSDGRSFAKPGVESCELDATDVAPTLLAYTRDVVLTLPYLLRSWGVSTRAYGTKLAVTLPGACYPRHVDNACACDAFGTPHDSRWITCIFYLNHDCRGGDLRLWLDDDNHPQGTPYDIKPAADTLVIFFADRLVHEVLPTTADADHRYALTLWLVADQPLVSDGSVPPLCAPHRDGTRTRDFHFALGGSSSPSV